MKKWGLTALLALPVAVAGVVYGQSLWQRQGEQPQQVDVLSYICPVTGEELPCPLCCPLNQPK